MRPAAPEPRPGAESETPEAGHMHGEHHEGSPHSRADGDSTPGVQATDDRLNWLVENGYCGSIPEAQAYLAHALLAPWVGGDDQGDRPFGGVGWLLKRGAGRPDPDDDAIREAILAWDIMTLGTRQRDHLERDVLHAPLLRDWRTKVFRHATLEPEPWVLERVAHLTSGHRQSAIQHTTLDIMNRRRIGRLWEELLGRLGPPVGEQLRHGSGHGLLLSLWECQPIGTLLEGRDDIGREDERWGRRCGNARVCPWCHAARCGISTTGSPPGPAAPTASGASA